MEFAIEFAAMFGVGLKHAAPVLISLLVVVILLGLIVGKLEKWPAMESLYFAFITATTVGYGDIRPERKPSKLLVIATALVGLVFTGIIVAIGLHAAQHSLNKIYPLTMV